MTISADQLLPAAPAGGGKIPAQCCIVLPCLVPDSPSGRRYSWRLVPLVPNAAGGTTTLRELIAGGARGSQITHSSAGAGNDSRKRPRKSIGKPRTPESPVSICDDSGPESEDSEPRKRARSSEPDPEPAAADVAESQLFPINERCSSVPMRLDDDDDEKEDNEVSTELTLFDEKWERAGQQDPIIYRPDPEKQSETWRKLAQMKRYEPEDEEEEREKGVSTRLHLYEDPWTVRQKLKPMEVGSGDPMLALPASAGRQVADMLTNEDLEKLVNDRTVAVRLWDVDTESPHDLELVRRQVRVGSKMHWVIGFGGGWGREFVERRGLKEGDEIGLNVDHRHYRYNFRLIARRVGGGRRGLSLSPL